MPGPTSRRHQPSLFGGGDSGQPVGPARVDEALAATARRLPRTIHLGTSSWSFPGWAGIVYDRAAPESVLSRSGLAAYARHPLLRAVGVDRTYYAPVATATLASYAAAVPDDFRFLVKAPSLVTDPFLRKERGRPAEPNATFLDPALTTDLVVAPYVEGLGPKAGCLLFQFAPVGRDIASAPERFAERLETFLGALPRGPAYRVELRDRALIGPAYAAAIEATGAGHCVSVHPNAGPFAEQARLPLGATGPVAVRWMLHSGLAYGQARDRYAPFDRIVDEDATSRASIASLAATLTLDGHVVIVIANNKAEGSAPRTIVRLAEEIVTRFEPE